MHIPLASDSAQLHLGSSDYSDESSSEHQLVDTSATSGHPSKSGAAAAAATTVDSGLDSSSPVDLSQGRRCCLDSSDVEIDVEGDEDESNQDWSQVEKLRSQQPSKLDDESTSDPLSKFMIVCDGQNVKWRELMQRHIGRQPPNRCGECLKDFRCRSALVMHYRTHTDERPYLCGICNKSFATKGNLKTHLGVHREAQKLLRQHSSAMPPTPPGPQPQPQQPMALASLPMMKPPGMAMAAAGLTSAEDFLSRMIDLNSPERLKSLHPMMRGHPIVRQLQPPQSEPLELTKNSTICDNGVSNGGGVGNTIVLLTDKEVTSSNRAGATTCKQCGKACSCRSALEIHMRTHTKEKPFRCGHCGKSFSTKGNMRQHELTHRRNLHHEPSPSPPPQPPQLSSMPVPNQMPLPFSFPPLPPRPLSTVTSPTPPPPQQPPLSSDLVVAMDATTSTPVQPMSARSHSRVCDHCGKECPTRSALEIHRRSHTGEKPYRCPGCAKRFSTHGNMQAHVRRHCPETRAAAAATADTIAQPSSDVSSPIVAGTSTSSSPHFLLPMNIAAQHPWAAAAAAAAAAAGVNAGPIFPLPPQVSSTQAQHLLYSLAAAAAASPAGTFFPSFVFGRPAAVLNAGPFQLPSGSLASGHRM